MRVAFNALYLLEPHTGTARYTYNLLSALGRVDGINEYAVLSPSALPEVPETPSSFHWDVAPVALQRGGANLRKVAWEQRTFPKAARAVNARLMHIPYFAPPVRPSDIPVVVTIHDVINLRLPLYRASLKARAYSQLVTRAAKHAAAIIAVSDYTKRDVIELLGVPEERVVVIREAPGSAYRPVTDPARLQQVRETYGLPERFVLTTGIDARKNVSTLIGAFAAAYHEIGDKTLELFVVGDPNRLGTSPMFPDWRSLAAMFGVADRVQCSPVDEADLPALYSAASCFAFASLYEGFGLTPLEAMACGAPVVCSDRTSLPEVVGSAGILVNPEDPDRIGAALTRVLTQPDVASDISARGLAHVRKFSWDQVAAETSGLYSDVTGTRRD